MDVAVAGNSVDLRDEDWSVYDLVLFTGWLGPKQSFSLKSCTGAKSIELQLMYDPSVTSIKFDKVVVEDKISLRIIDGAFSVNNDNCPNTTATTAAPSSPAEPPPLFSFNAVKANSLLIAPTFCTRQRSQSAVSIAVTISGSTIASKSQQSNLPVATVQLQPITWSSDADNPDPLVRSPELWADATNAAAASRTTLDVSGNEVVLQQLTVTGNAITCTSSGRCQSGCAAFSLGPAYPLSEALGRDPEQYEFAQPYILRLLPTRGNNDIAASAPSIIAFHGNNIAEIDQCAPEYRDMSLKMKAQAVFLVELRHRVTPPSTFSSSSERLLVIRISKNIVSAVLCDRVFSIANNSTTASSIAETFSSPPLSTLLEIADNVFEHSPLGGPSPKFGLWLDFTLAMFSSSSPTSSSVTVTRNRLSVSHTSCISSSDQRWVCDDREIPMPNAALLVRINPGTRLAPFSCTENHFSMVGGLANGAGLVFLDKRITAPPFARMKPLASTLLSVQRPNPLPAADTAVHSVNVSFNQFHSDYGLPLRERLRLFSAAPLVYAGSTTSFSTVFGPVTIEGNNASIKCWRYPDAQLAGIFLEMARSTGSIRLVNNNVTHVRSEELVYDTFPGGDESAFMPPEIFLCMLVVAVDPSYQEQLQQPTIFVDRMVVSSASVGHVRALSLRVFDAKTIVLRRIFATISHARAVTCVALREVSGADSVLVDDVSCIAPAIAFSSNAVTAGVGGGKFLVREITIRNIVAKFAPVQSWWPLTPNNKEMLAAARIRPPDLTATDCGAVDLRSGMMSGVVILVQNVAFDCTCGFCATVLFALQNHMKSVTVENVFTRATAMISATVSTIPIRYHDTFITTQLLFSNLTYDLVAQQNACAVQLINSAGGAGGAISGDPAFLLNRIWAAPGGVSIKNVNGRARIARSSIFKNSPVPGQVALSLQSNVQSTAVVTAAWIKLNQIEMENVHCARCPPAQFAASGADTRIVFKAGPAGQCSVFGNGTAAPNVPVSSRRNAVRVVGFGPVFTGTAAALQVRPSPDRITWEPCVDLSKTNSLSHRTSTITQRTNSRSEHASLSDAETKTAPPMPPPYITPQFVVVSYGIQGTNAVASVVVAAVVPTLGFAVARQQAMVDLVQRAKTGNCAGIDEEAGVDAASSPTQAQIGTSVGRFFVGAAVMNTVLVMCLVLLAQAVGTLYLKVTKSSSWQKPMHVFARCHVAMVLYVTTSILMSPSLTMALVVLTVKDVATGHKVLAAVFALLLAAATVHHAVWALLVRERKEKYKTMIASEKEIKERSPLRRFLVYWFEGPGEWVMPSGGSNQCSEKQHLQFDAALPQFEGYSDRAFWFSLPEVAVQVALAVAALVTQLVPENKSCVTDAVMQTVILGGYCFLCVWKRPFQELFLRIMVPVITVVQMVILVAVAAMVHSGLPMWIDSLVIFVSSLQSFMVLFTLLCALQPMAAAALKAWRRFKSRIASRPQNARPKTWTLKDLLRDRKRSNSNDYSNSGSRTPVLETSSSRILNNSRLNRTDDNGFDEGIALRSLPVREDPRREPVQQHHIRPSSNDRRDGNGRDDDRRPAAAATSDYRRYDEERLRDQRLSATSQRQQQQGDRGPHSPRAEDRHQQQQQQRPLPPSRGRFGGS